MHEVLNHSKLTAGTNIPDTEIVAKIVAGDKHLYELLMRRHNQTLYRVIRSYLKEEKETEDAMQDTYLKAFEKMHQFRHDALFSTWLIRIGINVALGKLRRNKKLETAHSDQIDYNMLKNQTGLPLDPENIIIHKEAKHLLEKAIDTIPDKYRIVYVLREVEGLSVLEVAACLNLSESNVKTRLHRAKALLKENLYRIANDRNIFEFGNKRCDSVVHKVLQCLHPG